MRDDSDPRPRRKVSVHLTVRAAFTHFPGCCPDPIEPGEWMTRLNPARDVRCVACN